ncbi:hypothetical protein [Clostridium estertheticum]|uniref:Uncharacterized protein n=1 Tax=Clostridium estertheticum TaxID=238834 RepID=A0AA47I9U1_9CLOT|nr:hypothetical protein [Clostridium estertheticum]MBU3157633.1 hypothetical protein [Clostridium estertheticum]WAG63250.1 hypothetical protein LL038_24805 [Clostridium estertheticum]
MKYKFRFPWSIFIIVFFTVQVIGYGLNIYFLKIYTIMGKGISYSLTSTIIPLVLAFLIDYIYQFYNIKKGSKV